MGGERMRAYSLTDENRAYVVGYLRGMFDRGGSFKGHEIVLSNTKRRLLRRSQLYLRLLDIDSKLYGPYSHVKVRSATPIYRLRIFRKLSLERFVHIVGFRRSVKRANVLEWLSGRRNRYGSKKRPDEVDELIWRLRQEGVTFAQIGRRLGTTRQAVHRRYSRTREHFERSANSRVVPS